MAWWDGILETGGEIVGGTVDAVGSWTNSLINDKLTYQKDSAKSADPNAARKDQNEHQNNDGRAVVYAGQFMGVSAQHWALIGGGVILAGGLYLAMRGK
ncbi:hypothetical protein [Vibrio metschnikovii]|uniref:hypothetical protein n=1 Tax=Vibrio metschnikovii TaxID=28172 RepID=UPI00165E361E|nr:hypothetical protein [Vibrio metschnikovii]EKO3579531.1 hypothetical protein [Vibrio metschnikovii]